MKKETSKKSGKKDACVRGFYSFNGLGKWQMSNLKFGFRFYVKTNIKGKKSI